MKPDRKACARSGVSSLFMVSAAAKKKATAKKVRCWVASSIVRTALDHVLSQAAAEAKHQNKPAEAAEIVKPQLVLPGSNDQDVGDVYIYRLVMCISVLCMHLGASLSGLLYRNTSMGMCGFLPA